MATTDWAKGQLDIASRQFINQSDDPRVGSGRNGSTGGTLSHLGGSDSSALSSLGGALVPVAVYSAVCLLLFLVLRPRCTRVYAARTIPGLLLPHELSPLLPGGWFNWIKPLIQTPDASVIGRASLDAFFFLRYVKTLGIICFVGLCLTWPVLLPLHGTGGSGLTELDLLTIGNVLGQSKLYAHAVIAWVFFGFILFMISRECIFYINLRQAYLLSPYYSQRLSSRTVLFTSVPRALLDERKLKKLFGDSVKNVWIPRNTKTLADLVKEREQTAIRLEKAEITLIKKANAARIKKLGLQPPVLADSEARVVSAGNSQDGAASSNSSQKRVDEPEIVESARFSISEPNFNPGMEAEKEQPVDPDYVHPYGLDPSLPDVRGSVAAQWIPVEARPTHRPLANYGRRVDTIRWTRLRLKVLSNRIYKLRREFRAGKGTPVSSAFVEFDSQASAQAGYQLLAHHRPLHMTPGYIGIRPDDVIWSTLRMPWWERIMRRFLFMGVITAAIIFWSIPSAIVGAMSHVKYLSKTFIFLSWLSKLPEAVTSVIEGLLPALALSLLMAAVPMMLRACARASGVPSLPLIELFTQSWYFVFQVVQVFLITTLTSAASAAFTDVLQNPLSAKDLLSQNLPKASNFYLSYILVQCLAGSSGQLLSAFDLIRHTISARAIESPRQRYKIWYKLRRRRWGAVFPVFTNMGVIAICYSCIAPLILVFAGLGMAFVYFVAKYNLIYSYDSDIDTKGLLYPQALMQLFVGLYMAEICMVGLFALRVAAGPLLLMIFFLVFTVLVHISLSDAVSPLLNNLPRSLALQDDSLTDDSIPNDNPDTSANNGAPEHAQGGSAAEYYNIEEGLGMDNEQEQPTDINERGVEGASGLMSSIGNVAFTTAMAKLHTDTEESGLTKFLGGLMEWITPDINKKPNFLMKWLHPEAYEDFHVLKQMVPSEPPPFDYPELFARRGYLPPEMWLPTPKLWIPRDEAHVSRQEVAHTRESIPISDHGAWLGDKGQIIADLDAAPFREPRILH